jgi:putative addiction module CopG family antidote
MHIELPPELKPFIEQEFSTGRYASREEVIVQALCWLRDERRETLSGIREGLDDVAAGRVHPLSEAFADIRKEHGIREAE